MMSHSHAAVVHHASHTRARARVRRSPAPDLCGYCAQHCLHERRRRRVSGVAKARVLVCACAVMQRAVGLFLRLLQQLALQRHDMFGESRNCRGQRTVDVAVRPRISASRRQEGKWNFRKSMQVPRTICLQRPRSIVVMEGRLASRYFVVLLK